MIVIIIIVIIIIIIIIYNIIIVIITIIKSSGINDLGFYKTSPRQPVPHVFSYP
jgi:hypothetical protein